MSQILRSNKCRHFENNLDIKDFYGRFKEMYVVYAGMLATQSYLHHDVSRKFIASLDTSLGKFKYNVLNMLT